MNAKNTGMQERQESVEMLNKTTDDRKKEAIRISGFHNFGFGSTANNV